MSTYRIWQTDSGRILDEGWEIDVPETQKLPTPKRATRKPVGPKPAWNEARGMQVLPRCTHCNAPLIWRGVWRCDSCCGKGLGVEYDYLQLPTSLPREALEGVPLFSARVHPKRIAPAITLSADGKGAQDTEGKSDLPLPSSGSGEPSADKRDGTGEAGPVFSSYERNNSTEPTELERSTWLMAVEAGTSFHRRHMASRLAMRGIRKEASRRREAAPLNPAYARAIYEDVEGRPESEGERAEPRVPPWYAQRVVGQAERFERIRACGEVTHGIEHHGKLVPIAKRCDCWRVCPRCLGRRRWLLQTGMTMQRANIMRGHKRELARVYRGKEGRWSEKLLTFTVPHGPSPAADARLIVAAWQRILRKIRTHLMSRGAVRRTPKGKLAPISVPWCRALEIGVKGREGHAHLHVWWVGPFLDIVLLRKWWGELIVEAGRAVPMRTWESVKADGRDKRLHAWMGKPKNEQQIPWPVVDIRSEKANGIAAYTQKVGLALYTQKGSEVQRLEPAHVAAIYEVFEGTRATQWARGWAPVRVRRYSGATFRRLTEKERDAYLERRVKRDVTMRIRPSAENADVASADHAHRKRTWEQLGFDHT